MSDSFFHSMGLKIWPGIHRHFIATDTVTGWFEAYTHHHELGRGYMVRDQFVFQGWESSINGHTLNRPLKALSDTVYPWGHVVDYHQAQEVVVLHQKKRILSLQVSSTHKGATFAIRPRWASPWDDHIGSSTPIQKGSFTIIPPLENWTNHSHAPKNLHQGNPSIPGGITSYAPPALEHGPLWIGWVYEALPGSLTLHLCFGESEDELLQNLTHASQPHGIFHEWNRRLQELSQSGFSTNDTLYDTAVWWAQASAKSLVTREFGLGIWAGLPWFKDNWGRDTFIALPGTLLVTGSFSESRDVLFNFARFQNNDPSSRDHGRIPNRVNTKEILYNTVDGTPWLIRELWEHMEYTGDQSLAQGLRHVVETYLQGARAQGFEDPKGLLMHDHADTWMDARIEGTTPWSPRGPWAVEIQALWYTAQQVAARLAELAGDEASAAKHHQGAQRTKESFALHFIHGDILVDRLHEDRSPDMSKRPNALMVAMIPFDEFVPPGVLHQTTKVLAESLLLPHGILSLEPDHPWFHPLHESPAHYHKDAAYHNGTIWGWNAGFTITALCRCGWQDLAWELTRNLADQIFSKGTLGTMSELVDPLPGPDGRATPSGTFSQAWSVSEFARNAWQDFLGFTPRLMEGAIYFAPAIPTSLTTISFSAPFGLGGQTLNGSVQQSISERGLVKQTWSFETLVDRPSLCILAPGPQGPRTPYSLAQDQNTLTITWRQGEQGAPIDSPRFRSKLNAMDSWPSTRGTDVLLKILDPTRGNRP